MADNNSSNPINNIPPDVYQNLTDNILTRLGTTVETLAKTAKTLSEDIEETKRLVARAKAALPRAPPNLPSLSRATPPDQPQQENTAQQHEGASAPTEPSAESSDDESGPNTQPYDEIWAEVLRRNRDPPAASRKLDQQEEQVNQADRARQVSPLENEERKRQKQDHGLKDRTERDPGF